MSIRRWAGWVGLLLLVAAPLLLWLPDQPPSGPGAGVRADLPDVDRFVVDRLAAARLPGAALAVTRGDQVLHLRGFGQTGDGDPVGVDTRFRIGSLTKAFTATAVLRLVEEGRVELDAPVRDYLPGFTVADPRGGAITVRHLLNQTSGLADTGFPEQTMPPPADLAGRVASLRTARLVSAPGTRFHYFNPNYDLLARLIEVVAGQPYDAWLRTTIFAPLGMRDTSVVPGGGRTSTVPDGHILVYGVAVARPELDGFLGGNGSVVSTARDLSRWLVAQATGSYAGHRLLTAASLDLMRRPPAGVDSTYGMGWTVEHGADGVTRLTHPGVLSTYDAESSLAPDTGTGVVMLFNSANALGPYHAITQGVAARLDGHRSGGGFPLVAVELPLACLTLLVLAVRSYRMVRFPAWSARAGARPAWRTGVVVLWWIVPTGFLVALPWIVGATAGRVFSRHQLLRSMPSVHGFLGVAAMTGLALAALRITAAVRHRRGR